MIAYNKQISALKWEDYSKRDNSILTWSHQIDYPVSQNRKQKSKAQSSPSQEIYWGINNLKHRVIPRMSAV